MKVTIKTQHLKATMTHASLKDVRYYLRGVLLERAKSGRFYLVATDGSRIAVGSFDDPECDRPGPWSVIIPIDTCKAAIKNRSISLTMSSQPDERYALGDVLFRPVEGVFPDWRRACGPTVLPATMADVDSHLLADAVDFVRTWSGDKKQGRVIQQGTQAHVTGKTGDCFAVIMGLRKHKLGGADSIPRVGLDY